MSEEEIGGAPDRHIKPGVLATWSPVALALLAAASGWAAVLLDQRDKVLAEKMNVVDERFNTVDVKIGALDQSMAHRFDALQQSIESLNASFNRYADDTNERIRYLERTRTSTTNDGSEHASTGEE